MAVRGYWVMTSVMDDAPKRLVALAPGSNNR
jgi:hypothetical protein